MLSSLCLVGRRQYCESVRVTRQAIHTLHGRATGGPRLASRRHHEPGPSPERLVPMSVAGSSRIPLVDLGAQYRTIRDEVMPAIEDVIQRSAFIHGPFVAAFEREMAAFAHASHCVGSANGTEAIFVALKALGVTP